MYVCMCVCMYVCAFSCNLTHNTGRDIRYNGGGGGGGGERTIYMPISTEGSGTPTMGLRSRKDEWSNLEF